MSCFMYVLMSFILFGLMWMGSGIATALILSNYPVILKEVNEKFLDAGINRIKGENRFL